MRAPAVLRRRPVKIVVDAALAAGFVVEVVTRERSFDPDYLLHSWTGIALLAVLALHLGGNWGWIRRVATRRNRDREARLGLLDLGFGVATLVCIVSGVPLWLDWTEAPDRHVGAEAELLDGDGQGEQERRGGHLVPQRSAMPGGVRVTAFGVAAPR